MNARGELQKLDIDQQEIARAAGLSQASVSKMLSARDSYSLTSPGVRKVGRVLVKLAGPEVAAAFYTGLLKRRREHNDESND